MAKTKGVVLLGIAIFAMTVMAMPAMAGPDDRELPDEDDIFWQVLSVMSSPTDTIACQSKINEMVSDGTLISYINTHRDELKEEGNPRGGEWEGGEPNITEMAEGFNQICAMLAQMPAEMQSDMAQDGVTSSLFSAPNWHSVSGLYFEKAGEGKITFSQTVDFLTYRFFRFMSNFENMVQFSDGYISLNAAMVPDMINYGVTLTMYGLDEFTEQPDIYATSSNGRQMKKAVEGVDLSGVNWNEAEKSLSFTPAHFSAFRVVQKGAKLKKMKITSVTKRNIRYNANKNTFRIRVRGRNLKKVGSETSCILGFEQAQIVRTSREGKRIICTFKMADFSTLGYYPLTVTIPGTGEVTKANAVRIR